MLASNVPTSNCRPVINNSFDVLLPINAVCPAAKLAEVAASHALGNVPDVKSVPTPKKNCTLKLSLASFPNAPVVSAAKFKTFFSQVFADDIVTKAPILLLLSESTRLTVKLPVRFDLIQNANVNVYASDVPLLNT